MTPRSPIVCGFVGDLLVSFNAGSEAVASRSRNGEWICTQEESPWQLCAQPPADGWRGYPLSAISAGDWQLWLLGELFGAHGQGDTYARVLHDLALGKVTPGELSGHFLLWGWNRFTRRWHVWTDRFGTLHAYHTTDGRRAAVGTFFPAVAAAASRRGLDWAGLTGFFALGFFPQDRTYVDDVRILRPASHYVFGENGELLSQERYWEWRHEPDENRSYDETVAEFGQRLHDVMADQTREGRIAVPISGGLDSRTTVAVMNGESRPSLVDDRFWSYSYGYGGRSVETQIAQQVAQARRLPFQSFAIRPYLFEQLGPVLASVEGFQDVTQARQAAVADEVGRHADYLIAAHWGDVWLDDMGLANQAHHGADGGETLRHALHKMEKRGRAWLLEHLCRPRLGREDPEGLVHGAMGEEMGRVAHIEDPDFRVKALKTDQWSFRWTIASLRMFQSAVFPRLPFYDTRLTDFFGTVPSRFVRQRQLQIDYLKRFAPDLAGITWQAYDTSLYRCRYFNSWLLPKRFCKRVWRSLTRQRVIARNWEVQFQCEPGRRGLEQWLLRPGLRLHEFVSPGEVRSLLDAFAAAPLEEGRGYTVSMLLTFSAWLEQYA